MSDSTRTLKVVIAGDSSGGRKAISSLSVEADKSKSHFGSLGSKISSIGKIASVAIGGAAVGGVVALGGALLDGVKGATELQQINAQTAAALKSTSGAAGVTATKVRDLANAINGYSTLDDTAVQAGENMLLTFTNIRNEAGKGNDVFNQTTKIMADMSVALGQDTKSSALQLGKALNDPVRGVTALQRVGVSFTEQQKKQIATLVESGHTLGAQKLILGELSKEFGGSAKAAGDTFGGALFRLKDTLEDTLRDALMPLLPVLQKAAEWLGAHIPGAIHAVTSALGPAVDWVKKFIAGLQGAGDGSGETSKTLVKLADIFRQVFDTIKTVVTATLAVLKVEWDTFGKDLFNGIKVQLSAVLDVISGVLKVIQGVFDVFAGLFTGDWSRVWKGLKEIFSGVFKALGGIAKGALNAVKTAVKLGLDAIKLIWSRIWNAVKKLFEAIFNGIKAFLRAEWAGFQALVINPIRDAYDGAKNILHKLKSVFVDVWHGIKDVTKTVWDGIEGVVKGAINGIISGINVFIRAIDAIQIHIPSIGVGPVKTPSFDWNGLGIPQIPMLAMGGTIRSAGFAVVGDAGPELLKLPAGAQVTPLPRGAAEAALSGASGGTTVVVNVSVRGSVLAEKELAKSIAPAVRDAIASRAKRSGGTTGL